MFDVAVGSRTEVFDTTDQASATTNGSIPALGNLQYDPTYQAFFVLLQNSGATALTAGLVGVASATDKSANKIALAAATDALQSFRGVRITGASSMAQNQIGWCQVSGNASFIHSGDTATAVDGGIVTSSTVAGKVEGAANSAAGAAGTFATAEAVVSVLDTAVKGLIKNLCI